MLFSVGPCNFTTTCVLHVRVGLVFVSYRLHQEKLAWGVELSSAEIAEQEWCP
jgi:hypothetical protein